MELKLKAVYLGMGLPLLDYVLLGGATVVRRVPWDGVAIIGELLQVGGVTDVEGRVLREKVDIVVGLVLVEGGWGGLGGVT